MVVSFFNFTNPNKKDFTSNNACSSYNHNNMEKAKQHQFSFYGLVGFLSVLVVYVFFISAGTWSNWLATSTVYDQIATSLSHGKLSLGVDPSPALLALPNPYDPTERAGISYPQDISLYKGKFYYYFGLTPALILLILKSFITGVIGDQYLVFAFAPGALVFQSLLMIEIRRRLFPETPPWLALPAILVIGLISPFGWMLNLASVYNAAILGGQFFFFAGLYSAFRALEGSSISRSQLVLAGIFWVSAIGSRMTQIMPISFTLLMVLIWIAFRNRRQYLSPNSLKAIIALFLPMFIGAIGLGWYNWARFDSVLETGITYQLAGPDLQKHQHELFSPLYMANNIYNYFLIKPELSNKFPFLSPVRGYSDSVIGSIKLPDVYFSQETAGLFYIAPFILFSLVSVTVILKILRKGSTLFDEADNAPINWTIICLLGSFLSSLFCFLFFFWAGVRYQADFMPPLVMLSVIGFWQACQYTSKQPLLRYLFILIGLGLIFITIINSNLIALSISSARYREFNPALWHQLTSFFNKLLIDLKLVFNT